MSRGSRYRHDTGQEVVEFALVLPLLLLMIFGIMEFGIVVFTYDTIANAAREGARYGIIHPTDDAGIEAAARALTIGLDPVALQVDPPDGEPNFLVGDKIRVEVIYTHNLIVGIIIQAVGGNPTMELSTVATMQREQ